jgi:DNA-binding transcriptional MerR regulator
VSEPGYLRIGELARRTGASPELLRAWERRYGLLRPTRSQGGFRLYTAADEERIHRMKEYLARGVAAAEAARLAVGAEPPEPDAEPTTPAVLTAETTAAAPPPLQTATRELTGALDRFDEEQAHAVLDRLLAAYRIETILRDLLVPYLHDLGERWARGRSPRPGPLPPTYCRPAAGLARGWGQGHGPAVLACLPSEQHDLGLIAFGITLFRRGWRIIYLGPDTPISTIRQAAESIAPDLVVLAGTVPEPFADHSDAIADLARHTTLALGGAGATEELANRTGARLLEQDPVSAAQSMDSAMPISQHTSAPLGPA